MKNTHMALSHRTKPSKMRQSRFDPKFTAFICWCLWAATVATDDDIPLQVLSSGILGLCQGNCNAVGSQCGPGLECFRKESNQAVPGCLRGVAESTCGWFCIEKSTSPPVPPSTGGLPLVDLGSTPPADKYPLAVCQGDCDRHEDCRPGLLCFQRSAGDGVPPGCVATNGVGPSSNSDFCYDPNIFSTPIASPISTPTIQPQAPVQADVSCIVLTSGSSLVVEANRPIQTNEYVCINGGRLKLGLDMFGVFGIYDENNVRKWTPSQARGPGKRWVFQSDGNLVVYGDQRAVWASQWDIDYDVGENRGHELEFSDGGLRLRSRNGQVLWSVPLSTGSRPSGYIPGKLTVRKVGLLLSEGLDARLIATSDEPVVYSNFQQSQANFHVRPDAGATFADTRPGNPGGFVYVSNAEAREEGQGGVGAITFDAQGNVLDYRMLLTGTTMNCGGGRTAWSTWVTCEEKNDRSGKAFQVDPLGQRSSQQMTMGNEGGRWESFAFDARPGQVPRFFMTEDHPRGALLRFTPTNPNSNDPWTMLHGSGTKEYLILQSNGRFQWTSDRAVAMENARLYYQDSEGIDVRGSKLLFVSKSLRRLYTLDLDARTWSQSSTVTGLFDGQPDQVQRLLLNSKDLLYFTEEGGRDAGIHARDENARFYTIMESPVYPGETTGLAISPDDRFMLVAYQDVGKVFMIWRTDGKAFGADQLDIKYHDN